MKIMIGDDVFQGTPAGIIGQFQQKAFDGAGFPDSVSFLRFMRNNFVRMTDLPCDLPDGDPDEQAEAMIGRLADIGALVILEDGGDA